LLSLKVDGQLARNDFIVKENKKLDEDIKEISNLKEEIKQTLAKRKVVEDLQVDRSDVVNILNILSNQLPDGSSLKSVKQVGSKVTIIGMTQSNNKVSNYMTNLESSQFFTAATLIEIKAIANPSKKLNAKVADDQTYSEFTIEVNLKPKAIPVDPNEKKGGKKIIVKVGEKK
jgi:type IV pilus assembly protein PilN